MHCQVCSAIHFNMVPLTVVHMTIVFLSLQSGVLYQRGSPLLKLLPIAPAPRIRRTCCLSDHCSSTQGRTSQPEEEVGCWICTGISLLKCLISWTINFFIWGRVVKIGRKQKWQPHRQQQLCINPVLFLFFVFNDPTILIQFLRSKICLSIHDSHSTL